VRAGFHLLGGRASSASPFSSRWASALYDHRRMANRKQWKGPSDPDPDFWILPDERLGHSYDLNWALTNLSISPKGDAYLNLFPRGLQHLSKAPLTAEKATIVEQQEKDLPVFSQDGSLGEGLTPDQYKQSLRELRMYFSGLPNIFVNDGAVGSSNSLGATVRVISDTPETSLFLNHNLIRLPVREPYGFQHSLTVYCAKGLGEGSPSATVDLEKGEVQLRGATTFEQLQDVLANLFLAKGEGGEGFDLVKCDARASDSGEVSLVLDAAGKGSGYGSHTSELFGAKHVVVSANGISRLWKGITSKSSLVTPKRGDIVSGDFTTVGLENRGNSAQLPEKIFILSEEAGGKVGKVSKEEGLKLLRDQKVLLAGSGDYLSPLFNKSTVYAVSVGGVSEQQVNEILNNPEAHLSSSPKTKQQKKSKK